MSASRSSPVNEVDARAAWQAAFDESKLRDAEFTTISGASAQTGETD